MSEIVVAKRYADALFQLGSEKSILEKYVEDLTVVREVFSNNKQLNTFLLHPKVNGEQKEQLLTKSLKGLHTDVVNTVKLLVARHRTALIPSFVDAFVKNVNDAKGIEVATVYSVRELTDAEKQNLQLSFAKRLGKNTLEFNNVVDPSLIGGIKIRVGNTIYDGTISGKLGRIKREITVANI
ncbi:F0F1 ATP synthase subunit delta [Oceanobacillus sp. FSL H7-0719]|uniref:F0F1 ATP synthase subunit delta n=1 Tax=Oceanobacillus sp. FSL H7-0719 TaxID=2954507 RepID=UPI00324D6981